MSMLTTILLQALSGAALGKVGAALGAAIAALAAAFGIGKIGAQSAESIARQPESAKDIKSNGLILAAMVEGAALFGIIVCMMVVIMK